MRIDWAEGFEIRVSIAAGEAVISANKEGLLSLAEQLTALAEEPAGSHIHYDENNSLEAGSAGLIIEKKDQPFCQCHSYLNDIGSSSQPF